MDRKNKVWLIILVVLLILAVVGVVVIRGRLTESEANYVAASALLTQAQDSSAALQTDLDAARAEAE